MKRLLSVIIALTLFASPVFAGAGAKGWGKGHSNSWSTWTLSGCRAANVNTAAIGGLDGYIILDKTTPYYTTPWDNTTGWTIYNDAGCVSEISPAGQLRQYATGNYTMSTADRTIGTASTSWSLERPMKIDAVVVSSNVFGSMMYYSDNTRSGYFSLNSTAGGNFQAVHRNNSYAAQPYDLGVPVDTAAHIWEYRNNGGANGLEVLMDGKVMHSNGETCLVDITGHVTLYNYATTGYNPETHADEFSYWNAYGNFTTTNATATSADEDTGAGNAFMSASWEVFSSGSATMSVEARTADSSAGLAAASWFSIASGVTVSAANQKEFYTLRSTLLDEGAGLYSPQFQKIVASWDTGSGPTGPSGLFNGWGGYRRKL